MKKLSFVLLLFVTISSFSQKVLTVDEGYDFHNNYALVRKGSKLSFIDTSGNLVGDFNIGRYYSDDLGLNKINENGIGLISNDTTNKTQLKNIKTQKLYPFYGQGMRTIKQQNGYFIIQDVNDSKIIDGIRVYKNSVVDKHGEILFTKYAKGEIYSLKEGVFCISQGGFSSNSAILNNKGEILTNFDFSGIGVFSNGIAKARIYNEFGEFKWGFINKKGEMIIKPIFSEEPSDFQNGFAIIKSKDGYYGYLDTLGNVAIQPTFRKAFSFYNNHAVVMTTDMEYEIIDNKGVVLKTFEMGLGSIGILSVENGLIKYERSSRKGFMNEKGEILFETDYYLRDFNSGLCYFSNYRDNSKGYLNLKGEIVITLQDSKF